MALGEGAVVSGVVRGREWEMGFARQGVCNNWRREGRCSFGDRCKFFHDTTSSLESKALSDPPQPPNSTEGRPFDALQRWREGKEGHKDFYKTKLCEKFATLGRCPYDDRCTYAHGYEELRPYPRHAAAVELPFLPESSEKGTAAMSEAQSTTSDKMKPRDTISDSYPYQLHLGSSISYIDKVKALCASLSIGTPSVKPGALQEALTDLKSRSMLKY